jgi:restriction system protein
MDGHPILMSPIEFERQVRLLLDALGADLDSYTSEHREQLDGSDGTYEIDVSVRFNAMNADFLVLVECKHQKANIKRDIVQVLHSRLQSTGAHKGIIFATTGFQRGAIEYAQVHGIALVRFADGATSWMTRSAGPNLPPPPWANISEYVGWWTRLTDEGNEQHTIVSTRNPQYFQEFLAGPQNAT